MNERITIRVAAEMKKALERFHQEQVTPMRTRQDAFRHIVEDWLIGHGYLQPQPNREEGANPGAEQGAPRSVITLPFRP